MLKPLKIHFKKIKRIICSAIMFYKLFVEGKAVFAHATHDDDGGFLITTKT